MASKRKKTVLVNASFFKRIIAFIIDMLIIHIFILYPLNNAFQEFIQGGSFWSILDTVQNSPQLVKIMYVVSILSALITIAYFGLLEYRLGQSVGKIFLRLKVINLDKKVTWWKYFVRPLFVVTFFPFIILTFLDPIWALFNPDNQRLLEKITKTKVVEERVIQRGVMIGR